MRALTASITMGVVGLAAVALTTGEASAQRGGSGGRGGGVQGGVHGNPSVTGHRAFVGDRGGYGARRQRGHRDWRAADFGAFAGGSSGPVGYDDVYEYRYTYTNYPYTYGNDLYDYSYVPVPYGYQVGYTYPNTFTAGPLPVACALAARQAFPCR
jgi:hypothetical protein